MKIKLILGATILLLASATSAYGAILQVDGSGYLIGATGVDVGGKLYDVEFVKGTCIEVFNGCDSESDFAFINHDSAIEASNALLSQVFIDSGGVSFDSLPNATRGCDPSSQFCTTWTAWYTPCELIGDCALRGDIPLEQQFITTAYVLNLPAIADSDPVRCGSSTESRDCIGLDDDVVRGYGDYTWARWTSVSPVPVPAAVWLFGTALIGLVGFSRNRCQVSRFVHRTLK